MDPVGHPTCGAAYTGAATSAIAPRSRGMRPAGSGITGRYLGIGVSMIVQALNPAQIVVGGEITGAWDLVEPAIRAEVARRALTPRAAETPVLPEPAGRMPRLRGAIALVAAPVYAAPQVG